MLVRDCMTQPAITVTADTSLPDAMLLMRERRIRRLPVVDKHGMLVGIVSDRDLLHAAPSRSITLNIWELNRVMATLLVRELMTVDVITARPTDPIEAAAQAMVVNKIGGLPVVDEDGRPVGVITETDVFEAFVEIFGSGQPGVRLVIEVPQETTMLLELTGTVYAMGGTITSLGSYHSDTPGKQTLFVKVQGIEEKYIVKALETLGDQVLDVRTV